MKKLRSSSSGSKKWNLIKKLSLKLRILGVLLFLTASSYGNETKPIQQISYNVVRNQTVIGTLKVTCGMENSATIYYLESNIDVRFILRFVIKGKETSVYKNGVMVYSSVFRKVNNTVKANHNVVYENQNYHEKSANTTKVLDFETIQDNLVKLYLNEPKGIKNVYCDNIRRIVRLETLGNGKYKVDFSDGKYNIFHYKDGKCVKIEANSTLFSVTLIPVLS
ncbi:hypothetical protein H7U19_02320 [Hyunsoonleella sp. SJ7]|uniref:Uncharacterized protein n=1 Tax=Hyunsoonleella aquatilis TaxID=2762758 RepID=A0A923KJD2_9FLAO|nr:DUF6134 family protein [Hyunsoonleella aquatilis]MBC3757222.1 hypothetical protein [Hyunsoonleella aquatilis]